jgi:hypothetical protein
MEPIPPELGIVSRGGLATKRDTIGPFLSVSPISYRGTSSDIRDRGDERLSYYQTGSTTQCPCQRHRIHLKEPAES